MYNYELLSNKAKQAVTEAEWNETIDRIIDTLDEYSDHGTHHDTINEWNKYAIAQNLTSWAENKADMITKFKAHPSYDASEPFKIVHDVDAERIFEKEKIYDFAHKFKNYGEGRNSDYYGGDTFLSLVIENFSETFISEANVEYYNRQRNDFSKEDSWTRANYLASKGVVWTDEISEKVAKVNPHEGQKVNKLIRKLIMAICGKVDEREFAVYSDALNPVMFKRKATFSVDPVDYLMMSHGNSWASCYWINQYDPGSYEGCYSNGTWSYMGDKTCIIMSVVGNSVTSDYAHAPKIYRQCVFFNGEDTIINSRVYPANDETCGNLRKEFRGYAQQFISELYNLGNNWNAKETSWDKCDEKLFSFSEAELRDVLGKSDYFVGYTDPFYYNLSVSINKASIVAKEGKIPKKIVYGAKAYCPVCGDSWYGGQSSRYVCDRCDEGGVQCAGCGNRFDEDDLHYCEDSGDYRCEDCCTYCEHYGEYYAWDDDFEDVHVRRSWGGYSTEYWSGRAVENDACRCEVCDELWRTDDMRWVEGEQEYYCPDCYEERVAECEDCCVEYDKENLHEYVDPDTGEVMLLCDDCYEEAIAREREREENESEVG